MALDERLAAEIAPFNTAVTHAPDEVVIARSAADVTEAVRLARQRGVRATVQGAGHGAYAAIRGGILVSTRRMDGVTLDVARGVVTAQAGAQWGAVIAQGAPRGLAPITGSSPTVGVVGYLLGGGIGPLIRSHGFSSDYVESFEVVTGEGEHVEASASRNADLFWALRGGKHGLGIVTSVRVRLVPLRALYAGALVFDEPAIERALRGWVQWLDGADPHVSTSAAVAHYPPLDFIPAPLRGRRVLSLRFAFPGSVEEGARLAAPLRALAPIYIDRLGELPLADVAQIHQDPTTPAPSWVAGALLTRADDALASAFLAQVGSGTDGPILAAELRHLGAAAARDVEGGSAVSGRTAGLALGFLSVNPTTFADTMPRAADRFFAAVAPWRSPEGNPNFAANGGQAAWLPEAAARLDVIRKKYDPRGLFAR